MNETTMRTDQHTTFIWKSMEKPSKLCILELKYKIMIYFATTRKFDADQRLRNAALPQSRLKYKLHSIEKHQGIGKH